MTSVLLRRRGDRYTVKFSYDPDLVELLKGTVPGWARSWDTNVKEWTVAGRVRPNPGGGDRAGRPPDCRPG